MNTLQRVERTAGNVLNSKEPEHTPFQVPCSIHALPQYQHLLSSQHQIYAVCHAERYSRHKVTKIPKTEAQNECSHAAGTPTNMHELSA